MIAEFKTQSQMTFDQESPSPFNSQPNYGNLVTFPQSNQDLQDVQGEESQKFMALTQSRVTTSQGDEA